MTILLKSSKTIDVQNTYKGQRVHLLNGNGGLFDILVGFHKFFFQTGYEPPPLTPPPVCLHGLHP